MPLPLVGAHAVLEGVPEFSKNADIVNSKTGQIHDKMSGLGGIASKAGGLVGGAFKAMAIGTVGAVGSIGAVGGAILKLGYDAANLPGIESVFKNMTNSMGVDADALMGKMREASYGAVKDFDLMKSANKAMVGAGQEFGKEFAENLPALMKVSREAAKAQGLSVEYMYDSIVTGIKRMSPMILDNLGFQISLGEAQEKYAAKVGKTTAELSKEEKQIALLNEVTRLGNQLVEESGGHVDSVQKSVTAWGTALANVKDRVGIELVPILQKFMDIVGKPGQGMQDAIIGAAHGFVQWLLPAIDQVVTAISALTSGPLALLVKGLAGIGLGGLQSVGEALGNMFTGGKINFYDLKQTVSKALEPLLGKDMAAQMGNKVVDLVATIQKGLGPLRDWITTNILPAFSSITGVIQGISDTLAGGDFPWEDVLPPDLADMAYNIVGSLSAVWDAIGMMFSGDWAGVGAQLQAVFTQLLNDVFGAGTGDAVVGFIGTLVQAFNDYMPGIVESVTGFIGTLVQAFNDNLPIIMTIVGQLGVIVTNAFNTILAVAQAVWPYVQAIITTVWSAVSQITTVFITTILPALLAGFSAVLEWVITNWPAIQSVIMTVLGVIGSVISAVVTTVLPWLVAGFQGIVDWVVTNWPQISATIGAVMEFIWDIIQIVMTNVQAFWQQYGDNIIAIAQATWDIVKTVVETAVTLVGEIIRLVMAVIRGDWGTVWDAMKNIISTVWEAIKKIVADSLKIVGNAMVLAWGVMKTEVKIAWDAIWLIISNTWESIKTTVGDALAAVKKAMIDEFGKIKTDWDNLWKGLGQIVTDVWNGIKQAVADGVNGAIDIINHFIRLANKVISKVPGASPIDELDYVKLAAGGILSKPVFVAGEAGSEVVAPLEGLLSMIKTGLVDAVTDMAYSSRSSVPYSGPQPNLDRNGDVYNVREYNLTTQSINRPGTLDMEFRAMELAHA